jgi:hypothetical protein
MRDQIREHVRQAITVLVAFVLASVVAFLPDVPRWSSLLAAVALLPPLFLLTRWIADPRAAWQRQWRRRVPALAIPVGVAVGALAVGSVVDDGVVARSLHNVEIVLDRSAAMAAELDGRPRGEIAAEKVGEAVRPLDDSGLALRAFGGDCAEVPELVVPFGTRRSERIEEAAHTLEPEGDANLVDAIVAAIDDFGDPDLYPDGVDLEDTDNRILVITASSDTCGADQARLEQRVRRSTPRLELAYTFIGFDVGDARTRDELRQTAAAVGADALFAETPDELAALVDDLVFDGVVGQVQALTDLINEDSAHVFGPGSAEAAYLDAAAEVASGATATESIRRTRRALTEARRAGESTEPRFLALRRPAAPPGWEELWRIDVEQRRRLIAQLGRIEELLTLLERDGQTYRDTGRPATVWRQFQAARMRFDVRNDEFVAKAERYVDSLRPA